MEIPEGPWQWLYYPMTLVLVIADAPVPASPSEVLVIGGGPLLAHGELLLPLVVLTAFAGSFGGDALLFLLFRGGLNAWLNRWRWGRLVDRGVTAALQKAGESSTYAAIVAARFIPGGRTASVAAAGLAEVPLKPFLISSASGSAIWAVWMTGLGLASGLATDLPLWANVALGTLVGILVGMVLAAVIRLRRRSAALRAVPAGAAAVPAGPATVPAGPATVPAPASEPR
ncbi:VTT domain-containing protein [Arthrobacter crystallopoietes]|uniref:DedA family protein n=1 Tax=Crystallibacter crystallopoietes TaxID=37928 RepID=UPI003D21AE2D